MLKVVVNFGIKFEMGNVWVKEIGYFHFYLLIERELALEANLIPSFKM